MLYKFNSRATGDLIMTEPVGNRVLRAAGREPAPQGIFEVADMPALIAALEAAITQEEALHAQAVRQAQEEGRAPPKPPEIALRQRAWPLIEMLTRAHKGAKPILWGV
jgi:hypothetical protein